MPSETKCSGMYNVRMESCTTQRTHNGCGYQQPKQASGNPVTSSTPRPSFVILADASKISDMAFAGMGTPFPVNRQQTEKNETFSSVS